MTPYSGGALLPSDDDEWEDVLFADNAAGTIPGYRSKKTGKLVLADGTLNPGYKILVVPIDGGPISLSASISGFREVKEYLDPDSPGDIDQACIEWAALDKSNGPELEEFLADKFGSDYGVSRMNPSTFKKCLQRAHKKGLIAKGNNGRWKPK